MLSLLEGGLAEDLPGIILVKCLISDSFGVMESR